VRYKTEGKSARYRLKQPRQLRQILEAFSEFVKTHPWRSVDFV
jgi:hypothetical protein